MQYVKLPRQLQTEMLHACAWDLTRRHICEQQVQQYSAQLGLMSVSQQ